MRQAKVVLAVVEEIAETYLVLTPVISVLMLLGVGLFWLTRDRSSERPPFL
ncbi:MAG: hypothetical protein ACREP9_15370 [Candidatus Dormibacteraceae bacterium]